MSRCEEASLPPIPAAEVSSSDIVSDASSARSRKQERLRSPGQFERREEEVKKLTSVNTFEGARVDVSKPMTPLFALSHNIMLGSSPNNPNANSHYKLGATVGDGERVCVATVDQHGTVEGQLYGSLLAGVQGKLIFNLPAESKNGIVAVSDVDYEGPTSSAQIKFGQNIHGVAGPHLGMSYFQSITPRLSMGGEGSWGLESPSTSSTMVAAAKYSTPKYSGLLSYATTAAQGDQLSFFYHRTVTPGRVLLGTELAVQPSTLEAQMAAGAEFTLKQSKVNLAIDGSGRMHSLVETSLSPAAKLTFSAEMQLGANGQDDKSQRDMYKFGYGLQIGQ